MPLEHVEGKPGYVFKRSLTAPVAQVFVAPMELDFGYQPFGLEAITMIEAYTAVGEVLMAGTADPIRSHISAPFVKRRNGMSSSTPCDRRLQSGAPP